MTVVRLRSSVPVRLPISHENSIELEKPAPLRSVALPVLQPVFPFCFRDYVTLRVWSALCTLTDSRHASRMTPTPSRKQYLSDISDEEWPVVATYLTLMRSMPPILTMTSVRRSTGDAVPCGPAPRDAPRFICSAHRPIHGRCSARQRRSAASSRIDQRDAFLQCGPSGPSHPV